MIGAYQLSQAIYVAATLGVADHLADGPVDSSQLAAATGVPEEPLRRLLRQLAEYEIFAEPTPKHFALTPLAALLRNGTPGSLRPFAVLHGQDWIWGAWGRLLDSVRTGRPAFDLVYGLPFFGHLQRDPDARAVFQAAMQGANMRARVAEHYDFPPTARVADIGGGQGGLLVDLLRRYPDAKGVLFERPAVLAAAREQLEAAGVLDRCETVAGNFFESVYADADVYVLSQVLHDWDDQEAITILANCRKAISSAGTLLVVERIAQRGQGPRRGPLADLNMMVLLGGRERSQDEYEALLHKAGFRMARVLDIGDGFSVLESVPVDQ
jgi:hypothetical protein